MDGNSSPPTVMVVDDNAMNLTLFDGLLGLLGCKVLTLDDGALVIEAAKLHLPAVVLMDIYMPGISGFDIVRGLKAESGTRDIPVYAVTAMDPKELADHADFGLFAGVLRKPPSVADLKRVLATVGALPAGRL
jgi:two-component system cell cycle response regulator DivK